MVLVKNWQLFILGEIGQENIFHDILERKIAFLDLKKKTLKKANNGEVFKGVIPKWQFFHLLILDKIGQEIVFHDTLKRKKRLSRLCKQEVKKVEKLGFFHRG